MSAFARRHYQPPRRPSPGQSEPLVAAIREHLGRPAPATPLRCAVCGSEAVQPPRVAFDPLAVCAACGQAQLVEPVDADPFRD